METVWALAKLNTRSRATPASASTARMFFAPLRTVFYVDSVVLDNSMKLSREMQGRGRLPHTHRADVVCFSQPDHESFPTKLVQPVGRDRRSLRDLIALLHDDV